jgi:hypothetical protein
MIENETNVIPDSEHHDPAEKNRGVGQRCVSRLPPANAPSDGYQPCKMFLYRWHALHLNKDSKPDLDVEVLRRRISRKRSRSSALSPKKLRRISRI